jgi:ubiquinone/menaquinone biosynthesis C-methylase UbiE
MGNYKNMSDYYDVIMTSGYYNYEKIVDAILRYQPLGNFLEIGCGTGLILELLAKIQPTKTIMGIDLTEEMLTIAQNRLQHFPNVFLLSQNIIDLTLTEQYDIAFSYGGVWYFVIDGDQEPFLVSHLPSDTDNHKGFARLAQYVSTVNYY